jgi:pyruvate dehydrogenase E1 component
VDARFVAIATLAELQKDGQLDAAVVAQAIKDLGVNTEKLNPATA